MVLSAYILLINLIALFTVAVDKNRARKRKWRVPESRLWGLAFIGGAIGIWLGMKACHHKTKHRTFVYGIPVLCLMNAAFYFLIYFYFEQ